MLQASTDAHMQDAEYILENAAQHPAQQHVE
jgi:hypothetical protein